MAIQTEGLDISEWANVLEPAERYRNVTDQNIGGNRITAIECTAHELDGCGGRETNSVSVRFGRQDFKDIGFSLFGIQSGFSCRRFRARPAFSIELTIRFLSRDMRMRLRRFRAIRRMIFAILLSKCMIKPTISPNHESYRGSTPTPLLFLRVLDRRQFYYLIIEIGRF